MAATQLVNLTYIYIYISCDKSRVTCLDSTDVVKTFYASVTFYAVSGWQVFTFASENTHRHAVNTACATYRTADTSISPWRGRYYPSKGERIAAPPRFAPGKNPFGAWDQSLFKRYALGRLINGPIVAPGQFQTCSQRASEPDDEKKGPNRVTRF